MAPGLVARMVVCSLLAIAPRAYAERRPVAVIDLTASTPARQLASQLTSALNNHAELKPLDNFTFNSALQGDLADEDAPRLAAARRHKAEAEEALGQQLDDANAVRAAIAGMDELENAQPTSEMLGLYADLAFAYGQALVGLRKPNDASHAFQLAKRLDPLREADGRLYPPNIVQAFTAAANKQIVAAKLVVRGSGRVWIDGIELGPAGQNFETSEGWHLVQITGADRETRGARVLVPSDAPRDIQDAPPSAELKVKRARLALSRARDPAERASAMNKLAVLLGVGDAVLILKDGNDLIVQTWRNREPGFSARMVHRAEPPDDLLSPLAPPPKLKIEKKFEPPIEPPPIVVEKRWYQKNWVRASIASGVVAGVISAILYARRDQTLGPLMPDTKWKDQ